MDITVKVINGIYGRPAEGVDVRVACFWNDPGGRQVEMAVEIARDQTDISGQARYTEELAKCAKKYSVEIDADKYFASLGIISCQRKITILFRVLNPADEYQVMSVLTPFMQATYCVRQARA
jgi:5-hydroxyisourate hydrolase-like protein (transthyretin family)